jgi:hypothetical protein
MIIRTRENSKSNFVEYKFDIFEVFYNSFKRIVKESDSRLFRNFKYFNFDNKEIRNKFEFYFNNTKKTNFKKISHYFYSGNYTLYQKEFWLLKGWSEKESIKKVSEYQSNNAKKFAKKRKENPHLYNGIIPTQLEYWIKKGFSEKEAKQKLNNRQSTFSLKKLKEKYNEEDALKIFNTRQNKWINSLKENYSEKERTKWRSYKGISASKISKNLFLPFFEKYSNKYTCYLSDSNNKLGEYSIKGENHIYSYDFTILELKLIFEFNGEHVHPNPSWSREQWNNWENCFSGQNADTCFEYYDKKIKTAEIKGFTVIQLWSSVSLEMNRNIITKEILNKLQILQQ